MQQLIQSIWRGFTWLGEMLGGWLSALWAAFVGIVEFFAAWVASFFANLALLVVEGLFALVLGALRLLPAMPEAPEVGALTGLEVANRYFPLGEVMALGGVWAAVFSAVGLYKLAKFVRGAG